MEKEKMQEQIEDKKSKYMSSLEKHKEILKKNLLEIVNETGFEKFTSRNLQFVVNELKEIEIIGAFLNDDFNYMLKQ